MTFESSARDLKGSDRLRLQSVSPMAARFMSASVWSILGAVGWLIEGPIRGDSLWRLAFLSLLTAIFGVWGFLHSGGPRITAAGMFTVSTGVFVGYAGLWWCNFLGRDVPPEMSTIVVSAYFATVCSYHLFWWTSQKSDGITSALTSSRNVPKWPASVGILLAAISFIVHQSVPHDLQMFTEAGAVLGILLYCYGVANSPREFKLLSTRSAVVVGLVVVFIAVIFDGFGRLPVIALAGSVGVLLTQRQRSTRVKLLALCAVPLASSILTALRYWRLDGVAPSRDTTPSGPDSDVGGLWTFARLVRFGDDLQFGGGETFVSTLVAWVPRGLWPSKPFGFGFDLTLLLEPQLAPYGHSLVATVFGEWYYNFGWWGIPILVLTVAPFVRWLDQRQIEQLKRKSVDNSKILYNVLLAAAIGGIPHLVWSGTHTLFARLMAVAILWVVVYSGVWLFGNTRSSRIPRGRG